MEGGQASGFAGMWPILILIALMYFIIIRPQQKRIKQQREMLNSLSIGTEVMTASGLIGKIVSIDESIIRLEIAEGVVIMMQKNAVSALLPPGTMSGNPEQQPTDLLPPPPSSSCGL